jgi:hypothetical protein
MKYLEGQDRLQQEIQTRCLDETVERGAEVRVDISVQTVPHFSDYQCQYLSPL